MVRHHNQNSVIQDATSFQILHPRRNVCIGNANQINRVMRQFAMKAEHKVCLVWISSHKLK